MWAIAYLVVGIAIFLSPFLISIRGGGGSYLKPLSLYSWVFSITHFIFPALAMAMGIYWHQSSYTDDTLLSAAMMFISFHVLVILGYLVSGEVFRYKRVRYFIIDRRNFKNRTSFKFALFIIGCAIAYSMYLLYKKIIIFGVGGFLANRIVLLAGQGYSLVPISWGLVIGVLLLASGYSRESRKFTPVNTFLSLIFTFTAVVGGIISGSRTTTFSPIVIFLISWVLIKGGGKISSSSKIRTMFALLVVVSFAPVLGDIRQQAFFSQPDQPLYYSPPEADTISEIVSEFMEYENSFWLIENSYNEDLLYGKTFLAAAVGFIPRSLWPEKPLGGGPYLKNMIIPGSYDLEQGQNISSYTTGIVAESYMNFGYYGIFVGFILGIIIRLIDRIYNKISTPIGFTVWIILVYRLLWSVKAEFFGNISQVFIYLMPILIVYLLTRVDRRGIKEIRGRLM